MFNFHRPIWHELIHNLTLWICCSLKIIVRQGNLIHSQSVPRHSSVSTAKINKKKQYFFVLFCFDFAARNRPVGITVHLPIRARVKSSTSTSHIMNVKLMSFMGQ